MATININRLRDMPTGKVIVHAVRFNAFMRDIHATEPGNDIGVKIALLAYADDVVKIEAHEPYDNTYVDSLPHQIGVFKNMRAFWAAVLTLVNCTGKPLHEAVNACPMLVQLVRNMVSVLYADVPIGAVRDQAPVDPGAEQYLQYQARLRQQTST